jgi:hypothetical protein
MDAFIGMKEQVEKACAEGQLARAEQIIQTMKTVPQSLQSTPHITSSFNDQASGGIGR